MAQVTTFALINDEFASSGKELFQKLREAAGSTPFIFYSTVVYPFSPRLADQSGDTLETPVPLTEVAITRLVAQSARPLPLGNRPYFQSHNFRTGD